MSEKDRKVTLSYTIWFNLLIGIYNLYIFLELNSVFHLMLGTLNIGVWVFFRHRLIPVRVWLKKVEQKQKRL